VAFVHIDCDLYSSTSFVLSTLAPRLDGATVAFDELLELPEYEAHEGRAFAEFLSGGGWQAEHLGAQWARGGAFKLRRR
jgi:hypothetical protein